MMSMCNLSLIWLSATKYTLIDFVYKIFKLDIDIKTYTFWYNVARRKASNAVSYQLKLFLKILRKNNMEIQKLFIIQV